MKEQKSSYQNKLVDYSQMWKFLICFIKKEHVLKELQLAATKLIKIKNSEDKSSFINEYILPLTNDLKQITNFLNPCQQQPQQLEAALVDLKKEIEIELQRLEKLINLLKQKAKIAAELQILKNDKQNLITAINFNDKAIKNILNNNEKTITELTNKVKASELNIKVLANNIEINLNLIAKLESNIKTINENIKVLLIKINDFNAIINNLENWSNSIWRRLINILTIGFFCNKKVLLIKSKKKKKTWKK